MGTVPDRASATDASQATGELGHEEARLLEAIVENIPDMIFVKDAAELRFVRFNRAAEQLLGYDRSELLGKNDHDFFPEEEASHFTEKDREVLSGLSPRDVQEETIHTRFNGERVLRTKKVPILGTDGVPRYLLGISEDITELNRAREDLQHTQVQLDESRMGATRRLELLGVLAGGIAHDFNNLLVGILGNASLVLDRVGATSDVSELVRGIQTSAERAAELTKQILAYSGKGQLMVESVDFSQLVAEVSELIGATLSPKTRFAQDIAPGLFVGADATQLRQLVMNLVSNANDALDGAAGEVSVTVLAETLPKEAPPNPWDIGESVAGEYVTVVVKDTGRGMPRMERARIFEPFFTTKPRGHGLGLAAATGIVQTHLGVLRLTSEEGVGTVFRVSFPRSEERPPSVAPVRRGTAAPHRRATVLIVDDEPLIRDFLEEALQGEGYATVSAADGKEGLATFLRTPERFDLAVLDVAMPGMNGRDVLREMRTVRPELPVLLSSGFDSTDDVLAEEPQIRFLAKPYRVQKLVQTVQDLLGEPPAAATRFES